ncbi:MAG: lipopolysaccharide heptosyltransferase II [Gemmatimonadaceae bacterium]
MSQESLIVQTSFLGDTILTTPLIAELARKGPVDVVVTPASAPVLANNPDIREIIVYDKRGRDAGVGGLLRLARRIRRRPSAGPRTAYLAQGSLRSAALAAIAGYPERIGFAAAPGHSLYTRRVLRREERHHTERLWRLAAPIDVDAEPTPGTLRPRLYPGAIERAAVDALLGDRAGAPFLALAPGSIWGTKRWPYYAELAARVSSRWPLVVVGGSDDQDAARSVVDSAGEHRVLDACGRLSLLASAELIGRARALVTNDSSPLHLASAMGTPTVALFGPTVADFGFGPLAPRSASLGLEALPCRPCHHHGPPICPLGHWRCMRELDVDRVEAHLTSILG